MTHYVSTGTQDVKLYQAKQLTMMTLLYLYHSSIAMLDPPSSPSSSPCHPSILGNNATINTSSPPCIAATADSKPVDWNFAFGHWHAVYNLSLSLSCSYEIQWKYEIFKVIRKRHLKLSLHFCCHCIFLFNNPYTEKLRTRSAISRCLHAHRLSCFPPHSVTDISHMPSIRPLAHYFLIILVQQTNTISLLLRYFSISETKFAFSHSNHNYLLFQDT